MSATLANQLNDLTASQVGEAIVGVLATLAPGALLMLLYGSSTLPDLSWVQFIIIVIALTAPVVAVHSASAFLVASALVSARHCFFIALCSSFIALYTTVILSFWRELEMDEALRTGAAVVVATLLGQSLLLGLLHGDRFAGWFTRRVLQRSLLMRPTHEVADAPKAPEYTVAVNWASVSIRDRPDGAGARESQS